jgi:tRNA nucleotidyltransferase/poly(A) polymerase
MLNLPSRWAAPNFPVTGRDLIELGFPSGPDLGRELKRLEDNWIASDFKATKDELLESIKGN